MKSTLIIVWMVTGIGGNDGVALDAEKVEWLDFKHCLQLKADLNMTQGVIGGRRITTSTPIDAMYTVRAYCVPHGKRR